MNTKIFYILVCLNVLTLGSVAVTSIRSYVLTKAIHKSLLDETTIKELKNEVLLYEHLYLKCIGDVEETPNGAHYSEGKIKFYKTP